MMSSHPDYVRKKHKPLKSKTLPAALSHRLGEAFPQIGGPRIRELCAEMILEIVFEHVRARDTIEPGQLLWLAVDIDDPPRRNKTMEQTRTVPVVLDLHTVEDVDAVIARRPPASRLLDKSLRVCRQAYEQGGLLSNIDLSMMLNAQESRIASLLAGHERATDSIVPRRATLHDSGTAITHKRLICRKRYLEGKESDQIAKETYHSIEAVDRYLGQFDRVRHCRRSGFSTDETAFTLNCSRRLVEEYERIDDEIRREGANDEPDQG